MYKLVSTYLLCITHCMDLVSLMQGHGQSFLMLALLLLLLPPFIFYVGSWNKNPQHLTSHHLSLSISYQLFPPSLTSSSTWLNHLVQIRPIHLLPFHFNSNALLGILVLSILLIWLNNWVRFSPNFVITVWHCISWRLPPFHNLYCDKI
jgi:hypothetical protein